MWESNTRYFNQVWFNSRETRHKNIGICSLIHHSSQLTVVSKLNCVQETPLQNTGAACRCSHKRRIGFSQIFNENCVILINKRKKEDCMRLTFRTICCSKHNIQLSVSISLTDSPMTADLPNTHLLSEEQSTINRLIHIHLTRFKVKVITETKHERKLFSCEGSSSRSHNLGWLCYINICKCRGGRDTVYGLAPAPSVWVRKSHSEIKIDSEIKWIKTSDLQRSDKQPSHLPAGLISVHLAERAVHL